MHSVCLGVVKKILLTLLKGPLNVRLSGQKVKLVSEQLLSLKPYFPLELNRKPRDLIELPRWKATEFRSFLLYTAPVVLRKNVPTGIYEHLLLHTGITILLSSHHISILGCNLANELLCVFLNHCEEIYGREYYVYNIHTLCHLSDEVEKHGPLDLFSAFPFENYLGKIKKLVKSPNKPLQQIIRRIKEINECHIHKLHNHIEKQCLIEHNTGPTLSNCFVSHQFKKNVYNHQTFTVNSYCMSNDSLIIQIHNIIVDTGNEFFSLVNSSSLMIHFFLTHWIPEKFIYI